MIFNGLVGYYSCSLNKSETHTNIYMHLLFGKRDRRSALTCIKTERTRKSENGEERQRNTDIDSNLAPLSVVLFLNGHLNSHAPMTLFLTANQPATRSTRARNHTKLDTRSLSLCACVRAGLVTGARAVSYTHLII